MLNWIVWNRTVYLNKNVFGINNLQRLICHKTQSNKQKNFFLNFSLLSGKVQVFISLFRLLLFLLCCPAKHTRKQIDFFLLNNKRSGLLSWLGDPFASKIPREFCTPFSSTNSGQYIYHFNSGQYIYHFNPLHNSHRVMLGPLFF